MVLFTVCPALYYTVCSSHQWNEVCIRVITPTLQMKSEAGGFSDQPKATQLLSGSVCEPQLCTLDKAEEDLVLATSVWVEEECQERQRRPGSRQDRTVPPPSITGERGTEGNWEARLRACSPLLAPFRYNVVWKCNYKKRHSLKTGAARALSPPEDFFCKFFCSLQETLGMLLGI